MPSWYIKLQRTWAVVYCTVLSVYARAVTRLLPHPLCCQLVESSEYSEKARHEGGEQDVV